MEVLIPCSNESQHHNDITAENSTASEQDSVSFVTYTQQPTPVTSEPVTSEPTPGPSSLRGQRKRKRTSVGNSDTALESVLQEALENIKANRNIIEKELNKETSPLITFAQAVNTDFLKWPITEQTRFVYECSLKFAERESELKNKKLI